MVVAYGPNPTDAALTPREVEVLGLVADGLTGPQIAERTGLSRSTVNTHVEHAREKLGTRTRTEAVAVAVRRGLLGPR
ncbi:MAG: response regulator transcription factor [Alphaproteobacteria bacterium]|nr:response regulator transcription factor [Alphaproteobacteria bacterium]MCB9696881.1 response regulator transcription factor [Alphaproteobacteria bacterium]